MLLERIGSPLVVGDGDCVSARDLAAAGFVHVHPVEVTMALLCQSRSALDSAVAAWARRIPADAFLVLVAALQRRLRDHAASPLSTQSTTGGEGVAA